MHDRSDADAMRVVWDERYTEAGQLWGLEPNRFLVEVAEDLPRGSVLDLGCGQGRNSVWLASRGFEVTGLDLSPVAVEQGARFAEDVGVDVEFAAADIMTWRPEGRTWDVVLLSYIHLPEAGRMKVHATAVESLAPGGRVIVIAHHLDNLEHGVGGPPYPELLLTEDLLREDFADLEIDRCEPVLRPVDKDGVSGTAIDILMVAHKP
ncbi:MAG: class I SAM-dependent methyltransferase [Actinomycetota bacterium]|nr:class I SAM-dependent methyltransferase [Actinomycetota bacterium]